MDRSDLFEGLAERYQRYRPGYPQELLEALSDYVQAGRTSDWPERPVIADVGAGTGISTRLLAELFDTGYRVVGVEPGQDMRNQASRLSQAIDYVPGLAEELPFPDASAALVFAAQAAHWFDRPAFYAQCKRTLLPGGTLALIYNNRQWRNCPQMEAYEQFLERYADGHTRYYRNFQFDQELPELSGFFDYKRLEQAWNRSMSANEFIELSLSTTKLQLVVKKTGETAVVHQLELLLAEHLNGDGTLTVPYTTELFLIRRSAP